MKITSTTCELRGVRAVRFIAVIPKSKKLKIEKRRQKTWTLPTCAPEFTKVNEFPAIEAEAKRWEAKVMAQAAQPKSEPPKEDAELIPPPPAATTHSPSSP